MSLVQIATSEQIRPGKVMGVQIRLGEEPEVIGPSQESGPPGTVAVAVARDHDGELAAIGNVCTHGPVLLSEGNFEEGMLECWGHGSRFCVKTGQPQNLPATEPVPVYAVTEQDGAIYLEVNQ